MTPFIGEIQLFCGDFAPLGWALCEGQTLQIQEYESLYSLIGTIYGGDGVNTFMLPDLRGRAPFGRDINNGYNLGEVMGTNEVYLTLDNMPPHNHTVNAKVMVSYDVADVFSPKGLYWATTDMEYTTGPADTSMAPGMATITLGNNTSSNLPISNYQPFMALNFMIALEGIYPTPT